MITTGKPKKRTVTSSIYTELSPELQAIDLIGAIEITKSRERIE